MPGGGDRIGFAPTVAEVVPEGVNREPLNSAFQKRRVAYIGSRFSFLLPWYRNLGWPEDFIEANRNRRIRNRPGVRQPSVFMRSGDDRLAAFGAEFADLD